ncbi:MAG: glycosyltransferase family protein [Planctomycetaceae bacterium]|jgi:spore coat polysaccharide biosynthesis protein SpsF|nr:glycosyltransferase family protein [Planctomycetaceae bacterium]
MLNSIIVIQARMGSSRLPGKVLKLIHGKSVLAHIVERVRQTAGIDRVIVATTTEPKDDPIVEEAQKQNWFFFRGSEDDVLARYYGAALEHPAQNIFRLTADNLFYDTEALADLLTQFTGLSYDYMKTNKKLPLGSGGELFSFKNLERAYNEATKTMDRDWVTSYFYTNPDKFSIGEGRFVRNGKDYSSFRLTMDTPEDWTVYNNVFNTLYHGSPLPLNVVLAYLEEHPEVKAINAHIKQMGVADYKSDAELRKEKENAAK